MLCVRWTHVHTDTAYLESNKGSSSDHLHQINTCLWILTNPVSSNSLDDSLWDIAIHSIIMSVHRNIYAGLGASSVAAIAAVFVSLPLESPDDIILNAASVGLGALIVGVISGFLWHLSSAKSLLERRYVVLSALLFVGVVAVAIFAQTQFDDPLSFTLPLALIIAVLSIVGTPIFATNERVQIWLPGLLLVIAVALSIALAGQGDQESGSLSLPPAP